MNEVQTLASILKTLPPNAREFMFMLLGGLNERADQAEARVAELEANLATEVDLTLRQEAEGIEHARAMRVLEGRHRDAVEATRTADARVAELEGALVQCADVKGALMESGKIQAETIMRLDTENQRLRSLSRMRVVPDQSGEGGSDA